MSTWIPNIFDGLDSFWRSYLAWPMMVAKLHVKGQLEGFSLGSGKTKGIVYNLNEISHEGMIQAQI